MLATNTPLYFEYLCPSAVCIDSVEERRYWESSKSLTAGTLLIWRLERKFIVGISMHLIGPAALWKHSSCPYESGKRNCQISLILWLSTLSQIQNDNACWANRNDIWNCSCPLNAYYHTRVRDHCTQYADFWFFQGTDEIKVLNGNDLCWQLLH